MISRKYTNFRTYTPDDWRYDGTMPFVIVGLGSGDDPESIVIQQDFVRFLEFITGSGYGVALITDQDYLFSNDTVVARTSNLISFLESDKIGAKPSSTVLFGFSMGGGSALTAAGTDSITSKVAEVVALGALTDLRKDEGSLVFNEAWPGGYLEARDGIGHNPVTMAAGGKLNTVPIRMIHGTGDMVISRWSVLEFSELVPLGTFTEVLGLEHNWMSVANFDVMSNIVSALNKASE